MRKIKMELLSDIAVSDSEDDLYNRAKFSNHLAEIIAQRVDVNNLVYGLYGPWGSGKTSVIKLVENRLLEISKKESNSEEEIYESVVCINFNPWQLGGEEQLLRNFFKQIASKLDFELQSKLQKLKEDLKSNIDEFMDFLDSIAKEVSVAISLLESIPASGVFKSIIKIASNSIEDQKVEDAKIKLSQALKKIKIRVVIFIDDIDRLDNEEIFLLFRLIKLTADFDYTTYVLAFDKDNVASALNGRYGQGNRSGEEFLEKIIHIPLNIPDVQSQLIQNCISEVMSILDELNIDRPKNGWSFEKPFSDAFAPFIATPRKSKQYCNVIIILLGLVKNEVNHMDFLLLEAIRVFHGKFYLFIKDNKYLLLESDKCQVEKYFNDVLDGGLHNAALHQLLERLFPRLSDRNEDVDESSKSLIYRKEKRICSEDYFDRYFSYAEKKFEISDREFETVIDEIKRLHVIGLNNNPLIKKIKINNIDSWISKFQSASLSSYIDMNVTVKVAIAWSQVDMIEFSEQFHQILSLIICVGCDNSTTRQDFLRSFLDEKNSAGKFIKFGLIIKFEQLIQEVNQGVLIGVKKELRDTLDNDVDKNILYSFFDEQKLNKFIG